MFSAGGRAARPGNQARPPSAAPGPLPGARRAGPAAGRSIRRPGAGAAPADTAPSSPGS